jgi:hypothetical protein
MHTYLTMLNALSPGNYRVVHVRKYQYSKPYRNYKNMYSFLQLGIICNNRERRYKKIHSPRGSLSFLVQDI